MAHAIPSWCAHSQCPEQDMGYRRVAVANDDLSREGTNAGHSHVIRVVRALFRFRIIAARVKCRSLAVGGHLALLSVLDQIDGSHRAVLR